MKSRDRRLSAMLRPLAGLATALLLAGCDVGNPINLLENPSEMAKSVAAVREYMGGGRIRVLNIRIEPDEFVIQAQSRDDRRHVDEWRVVKLHYAGINWDRLSGPKPVQLSLINPNLEANLFDLDEVNLKAANDVGRAAVARAKFEDAGRVRSMEIVRQLYIIPSPSSGPVRWRINVRSDREQAQVTADSRGAIVSADLAGTERAKTINLFDELPTVQEAAKAFRDTVGAGPMLTKVGISANSVGFTTNVKEKPIIANLSFPTYSVYVWKIGGLQHVLGKIDPGAVQPDAPFSADDVDWTTLPKIVAAARDSLAMPKGRIVEIQIGKPSGGVGTPVLAWEIAVADENDERGTAFLDLSGRPKQINLPESRRKPVNYYEPAALLDAFARIDREFGPNAKFAEIGVSGDKIVITAIDPRNAGEFAQIILDKGGFSRFGTPSMFASKNGLFAIADLKALTAEKVASLEAATLTKLGMPPNKISDVTIGRGSMDPSPQGNVTIEIRAEEKPFGRHGRVNYELDGKVLKTYLP